MRTVVISHLIGSDISDYVAALKHKSDDTVHVMTIDIPSFDTLSSFNDIGKYITEDFLKKESELLAFIESNKDTKRLIIITGPLLFNSDKIMARANLKLFMQHDPDTALIQLLRANEKNHLSLNDFLSFWERFYQPINDEIVLKNTSNRADLVFSLKGALDKVMLDFIKSISLLFNTHTDEVSSLSMFVKKKAGLQEQSNNHIATFTS